MSTVAQVLNSNREASLPTSAYQLLPPSIQPDHSYLQQSRLPSFPRKGSVEPKSKLLVLDVENVLMAPIGGSAPLRWVARPYLRAFLRWVVRPQSPYALAIWTHSTRAFALEHLRLTGVDDLLFTSADPQSPSFARGVVAFLGYEDSGLTDPEISQLKPSPPKDLSRLWTLLRENGGGWSARDTVLVNSRRRNAAFNPSSLLLATYYTDHSPQASDDFLLELVGALVDLAPESNFPAAIESRGWNDGLPGEDQHLFDLAECEMEDAGIAVLYPGTDEKLALELPYSSAAHRHEIVAPLASLRRIGLPSITSLARPSQLPTLSSSSSPSNHSDVTLAPGSPSSVTSFTDNESDDESDVGIDRQSTSTCAPLSQVTNKN